ncbi:MAG: hypothetical protein FWG89_03695 [Treponema sp.]|nr:hypothetical protein [Treponema sp.]
MENKKNWLGILVIMLIFGIMVIGCNKNTNNSMNNGTKLTITGLDVYEGQYIVALSMSVFIMPQRSTDSREGEFHNLWGANTLIDKNNIIGSKVSNGEVTLNVYYYDGIEVYTGEHKDVEFAVYVNTSENFDFSDWEVVYDQYRIGDVRVDFTVEGGTATME